MSGSGSGIVLGPSGDPISVASKWDEWGFPDEEDLPRGWRAKVQIDELVAAYSLPKRKLRIILGIEEKSHCNGPWIHLSVSHAKALPSHKTMMMCKELFIGDNREAIEIYPPKSRDIDAPDNCLHLWAPMDPRDRTWPKMETVLDDGTIII